MVTAHILRSQSGRLRQNITRSVQQHPRRHRGTLNTRCQLLQQGLPGQLTAPCNAISYWPEGVSLLLAQREDSFSRGRSESLTYKIKHVEEDVLRNLRMVIDKHDKEELQHYISKEWEDIAIVFDRFLFWIFFVTACTATLSLLVFKPLTKDINIETSELYRT